MTKDDSVAGLNGKEFFSALRNPKMWGTHSLHWFWAGSLDSAGREPLVCGAAGMTGLTSCDQPMSNTPP